MQNEHLHQLTRSAVVLFLLTFTAAADSVVEISGTLRGVNGVPLSGTIKVIREVPRLIFTDHPVDKTGFFKIESDSPGGLVLHAVAEHHAAAERVLPPGTPGVVSVDFSLPPAQDIRGRVIDARGHGVPNAAVRVRYHEPGKPVRRLAFARDERRTDGDGRFLLPDVGIQVPFVVDVLAPGYMPVSSERTTLTAGKSELEEDIVLTQRAGGIVVRVLEKTDLTVADATVTVLADPAGMDPKARGSWLHPRAFRQRGVTSPLGNVRFSGVPPGRIIVRVKTVDGTAEQRAVVSGGEELQMTLRIL